MLINWKAIPALRLLLPLSIGIVCSTLIALPFWGVVAGSLSFFIGLLLLSRTVQIAYGKRFWFGIGVGLCTFLLGYWLVMAYDESHHSSYFGHSLDVNMPSKLIVKIDELPVRGKRVKVVGKVLESNQKACTGHILLYFDSDAFSLRLNYGDIVAIQSSPYPINPVQNPYSFDFQNYMKLRNIRYSAFVAPMQAQVIAENRGNPIMHFAYNSQEALLGVLAKHLPEENDVFSVGAALILGSRSEISEDTLNAYVNTGAMHVLSVSGLHVGLVAMIFRELIKRIRRQQAFWKYLDPFLQLLFIWLFALITGASSCVLRAAVMFSFMIVGRSLSRDANVYNMLAVSALTLLCYNPYFLFDVSFQLSYSGLLSIVYFYPYIYKYVLNKVRWISEYWIINYFWEITALSLAAMIGTTPISIYYFHQFPTYFWLSGLIVVPAATAALVAGLSLFFIEMLTLLLTFLQPLGSFLGIILKWIILIMNGSLYWIEQIPPGVQRHLWLDALGVVLIYLMLSCIGVALKNKQGRWLKYASFFLLGLLLQYNYQKYNSVRQELMIVYSVGKDFLLDIIDGETTFAFHNQGISERSIDFAAYNCRLAHRNSGSSIKAYSFTDSLIFPNGRLANQFFQFKNKHIFIVDHPKIIETLVSPIEVDYLVIHNSPFLNFDLLLQKIKVQEIIFTAGNKNTSLNYYKKQCQNRGIAYFDIKEQGAFIARFD
jgi:competence protein ComEC